MRTCFFNSSAENVNEATLLRMHIVLNEIAEEKVVGVGGRREIPAVDGQRTATSGPSCTFLERKFAKAHRMDRERMCLYLRK